MLSESMKNRNRVMLDVQGHAPALAGEHCGGRRGRRADRAVLEFELG
jgi:hypothetical protein